MHNKYKQLLFRMRLIMINCLTALIIIIVVIILHKYKLIAYIFLSPFAHSG